MRSGNALQHLRLCRQLEPRNLRQCRTQYHRGPRIHVSWALDDIASGIAEGSEVRVVGKGAGVEERSRNAWFGIRITHQVGSRAIVTNGSTAVAARDAVNICGGVVIAGGSGKDARHLPIAKNLVDDAGSFIRKLAPPSEGQIVDVAENETLAHVEVGVAVVLVRKSLVLEISVVHRPQAGARSRIEGVREGVRRFVLEPVRVALLQTNLQRVVIRLCIRAEGVDSGIERGIAVGSSVCQRAGAGAS